MSGLLAFQARSLRPSTSLQRARRETDQAIELYRTEVGFER